MRRNGFTLVEFVVVLAIIGILASILWPPFGRSHDDSRREHCQSNLKQIGLALLQYSQDYDDKLPPLNNARAGFWVGSIFPYLSMGKALRWTTFQCPAARVSAFKKTDYFYNSRLGVLKQSQISFPARTIMLGDGADNSPLNYALANLPVEWMNDESSPVHRHRNRANYLFIDGHVKWVDAGQVEAGTSNGTKFSFALR